MPWNISQLWGRVELSLTSQPNYSHNHLYSTSCTEISTWLCHVFLLSGWRYVITTEIKIANGRDHLVERPLVVFKVLQEYHRLGEPLSDTVQKCAFWWNLLKWRCYHCVKEKTDKKQQKLFCRKLMRLRCLWEESIAHNQGNCFPRTQFFLSL